MLREWDKRAYLASTLLGLTILALLLTYLSRCSPAGGDGGDVPPAPPPSAPCDGLSPGDVVRRDCPAGGEEIVECTENGPVTRQACGVGGGDQGGDDDDDGGEPGACVDWDDVAPRFAAACVSCHRGEFDVSAVAATKAAEAARRVYATDASVMPPSGSLADSDRRLFKAWADGGAKLSCDAGGPPPRPKFTLEYVETAIVNDLVKADEDDRKNYRYLVTAHKANEGQDVATLEKMVNKTINSVSLERQLYKAVPVDPARVVFRIDLDELQINSAEWLEIQRGDKAKFVSQTTAADLAKTLVGLGDEDSVWFHAENFADIVHSANVYNALLDVQATFLQETNKQGVDYVEDLKDGDSLHGCITESSISASRGNRMVSVHASNELSSEVGGFWVTYDPRAFNGDVFRDCFRNPFLFQMEAGNKNFNFDASEWISLLPNGMLRYGLNAELEQVRRVNGRDVIVNRIPNARQNAAPTDIVADGISPVGIGPEIKTAISCPVCHNQGIIPLRDEVAIKTSSSSSGFNAQELRDIEDRYRGQTELDEAFKRTNDIFQGALRQLGINPADPDPINLFANQFKLPWNLNQLCNFVLLPDETECRRAIARSDSADEAFGQILDGGKVTQEIVLGELQKFLDESGIVEDK